MSGSRHSVKTCRIIALLFLCAGSYSVASTANSLSELRTQFTEMPMEARRLTGPLFWLHGNESKERLEEYIDIIAQGHNGSFCAESRPHTDWLGPGWYRDLEICLNAAKKHNLKMWIFDEKWWPSQTLGGNVPERYRAKRLHARAMTVEGPKRLTDTGFSGRQFIAALAGKIVGDEINGDTVIDLSNHIKDGNLTWDVPGGKWQVMKFTWQVAPAARQSGQHIVDGASKDCVDWFIDTVYLPHYERFKDDFGKTIVGYFYDEPETQGDWGTEMAAIFKERNIDWKKAYIAWKFKLKGEDQAAARYAYIDTLFEAWARTMYGGMTRFCEERGVESIGHFMEHDGLYLDHGLGAGNLMQMQKYSSMGGMDLVCKQLYPGERRSCYYMPRITSSISHVYNKRDHLAMCEIYGGYNQELTYMQMKWLADQHQVRGVNFMITHSFNPKSPNDSDYPPYFYNSGQEPRWPLYRVWADYNNRLSVMLTGGKHVCPVALLFCGNSKYVGKTITPERMTAALEDALYDVDWLPYDAFENDTTIKGKTLALYEERYKVLIVPPVEVIPYQTLRKAKQFFDKGGTVVGYDFVPTKSATGGYNSKDITGLTKAIWGSALPGLNVCKTNLVGGRSYLLPAKVTPDQIKKVFADDAGIAPTLQIIRDHDGDKDASDTRWLHVLHRVKGNCDIFFICNQYPDNSPRKYRLRARAKGIGERWDAMRNEITAIDYKRIDSETVEFDLKLESYESALIVFGPEGIPVTLAQEITAFTKPLDNPIILRDNRRPGSAIDRPEGVFGSFRKTFRIPGDVNLRDCRVYLEMDGLALSAAAVKVNGRHAGGMIAKPYRLQITRHLKPGTNTIEVAPTTPAVAKLTIYPNR